MSPTLDAFLCSWPFEPWLLLALGLSAGVYARGWFVLRRRDPRRWHGGRLGAFLGGLAAIFLALASPIEPFASLLLQVHMVQHQFLMMVAPPLLWLGAPLGPILRGLPGPVRVYWVAPILRSRAMRRFARWATHPAVALPMFIGATWLWHAPPAYGLALGSEGWHRLQHACFMLAGLLFWYPVVRPYPSRPRWSTWLLVPYLILADVQNTVLAALLTFSDRVLYAPYASGPRLAGISALADQSAAGVIMWVPGSIAFLLPLFAIGVRLLYGAGEGRVNAGRTLRNSAPRPCEGVFFATPPAERPAARILHSGAILVGSAVRTGPAIAASIRTADPTGNRAPGLRGASAGLVVLGNPSAARVDLARWPLLGRFLRWRHARVALQLPMLGLAVVVILDGLRGPGVSPMNLAGVLPWIHWRGLVVAGLLVAGNVSCMACPFLLPRTLARRWLPAGRAWPRALRSKWLAAGLVATFFWAYEAFSLWDRPWLTAWIVVGYFAAAFAVDGVFRGAAFCKYVCPIGQFNFVQSTVSPLEVSVRDPDVCASCRTKDCIRGRDGIPGCETGLFQPRKAGNMDCTFCLDCVHSCPSGNVGLLVVAPGRDLGRDPLRSGVGRFSRRPDLAALVLVLVFGAFANASGMVGPVLEWQERLRLQLGLRSPAAVVGLYSLATLVVLPLASVGLAAAIGRRWAGLAASRVEVATRFSFALVPLGFGMWLAHYGLHFLTGYEAAIPAAQRFARERGWAFLGAPEWVRACCRPAAEWIPRMEILALDAGLLLSLHAAYRIALALAPGPSRALRAFAPWAALIGLLFAAGVWIVLQPMQMRGTFTPAG